MSSTTRPVIGITSGEIHNKFQSWSPVIYGQSQTYVDCLVRAGGTPVIIPITTDEAVLRSIYELVDGICFAGGNDLHPSLYGEKPYPGEHDYSEGRDKVEQMLIKWTLEDKKPILGICRGMQLLNVRMGGTLHQDIATDMPNSLDQDASTTLQTLEDLSHTLRLDPESRLVEILEGDTIGANAHHHQSVKTLGMDIRASAWATDDVIEAIELTNYPYAVGIQAHPESLALVEPRWAKLFASFVDASKKS
jgi:putative glutamine amidotransferase